MLRSRNTFLFCSLRPYCSSCLASSHSITKSPRRIRFAIESQMRLLVRALREVKPALRGTGQLVIPVSAIRFKQLLHLCITWNEVKNWLSICQFVSNKADQESSAVHTKIIEEILHWATCRVNISGMVWIMKGEHNLKLKESPLVSMSNARKLVETISLCQNTHVHLRTFHSVLSVVKCILKDEGKLTKGTTNGAIEMLRREHIRLSHRFGHPSAIFQKRAIIRLLFRIFATVCKSEADRHDLFRTLSEVLLLSEGSSLPYLLINEADPQTLPFEAQNVIKAIFNNSRLTWEASKKIVSDFDSQSRTLNLSMLTQCAYLVIENDSPYYLNLTYEHLCAKSILPLVRFHHHILCQRNVEAIHHLCCLCAIVSLPECIETMNLLLSFLWSEWRKSDLVLAKRRAIVAKYFPRLHQQSNQWYKDNHPYKTCVSALIRDFILAATAEYVSPKDIGGWNIMPNCEKQDLPSDSHSIYFESLPLVHIPRFFKSVDELNSLLGPKVASLISESSSAGQPSVMRAASDDAMTIKVSSIIFSTRYGFPSIYEHLFADGTHENSERAIAESVLFHDTQIIVFNKLPGTNVAPTSKSTNIRRVDALSTHHSGDIFHELSKTPRYGIVHRLDNDVSGVVIIAKSTKHYCFYKNLFFQSLGRNLRRKYVSILHFYRLQDDIGKIHEKYAHGCMRELIHALGLRSSIIVETLEVVGSFALVRIELFHGMKHAIRRLIADPSVVSRNQNEKAHSGECVILGEHLYGPPGAGASALVHGRLALHAESIELPLQGDRIREKRCFETHMPSDMLQAWKKIRILYGLPYRS